MTSDTKTAESPAEQSARELSEAFDEAWAAIKAGAPYAIITCQGHPQCRLYADGRVEPLRKGYTS